MKTTLIGAAWVLIASAAQAQGCWAANVVERITGEDLPLQHPKYAALHAVMDEIERMVRPNPGLLALPDVRLRMKRQINHALDPASMPREAAVYAHGFGPKAWGRGGCELIPQADRLGPRAGFSFFINNPTATLNRWKHDEQLTTYLAAPATPSFQGWPTFGECAVLSPQRRLPWKPVTVGEMLAFEIRDLQRRLVAFDRDNVEALQPFDPGPAEREADRLQSQAPQAAEAIRLAARERKRHEAASHAAIRQGRARLTAELETLQAQQRDASPAQLAAPHASDPKNGVREVVRLDPAYRWDPKRLLHVQLLTVCAPQIERNPAYHPPMRQAVAALDFTRLAALLD
jgi:hypothetical protein